MLLNQGQILVRSIFSARPNACSRVLTSVRRVGAVLAAAWIGSAAFAQKATVTPLATPVTMPSKVDSNSPAYWIKGVLHLFNSTVAGPMLSTGSGQTALGSPALTKMNALQNWPFWMEATWVDPAGMVFGWYHQEVGPCGGTNYLAVAHIGAAVSYDGGKTFLDLGTIIADGNPPNCQAKNGFVAGGNGDFSVILDRTNSYFYFLYSSYGGQLANQGVAIARMPYTARFNPGGMVEKYYQGSWSQPGVYGLETPIFPAKVAWQNANTNSFWGPSVHWNTFLNSYVVLLNDSCCAPRYPQAGIYITYNPDLSNIAGWTAPKKLVDSTLWYPQVLGKVSGGSDTLAGQTPPLYIGGTAQYQITFSK